MNIELKDKNGITLKTAGKYCSEDVSVIPKLQSKSITPSETQQTATSDTNYAGLGEVTVKAIQTDEATVTPAKGQQVLEVTDNKYYKKVTVEAIPDDYVIPSGTAQITENGVFDVSGKANANVNVPGKEEQTKTVTITSNGSQIVKSDSGKLLSEVTIITNVSGDQPQLHAPTISKSDTIITITDSALNGDFVTGYKLYANNVLLSDQAENTADLSASITEYGNYSITAKCKGTNFQDSEASNAIEYVYEQIPSIYEVDGETLRVTNSNYITDGGILKLL